MNVRTKTSLIILITFVIGMLLGILLDRTLMRFDFHKKIARFRHPGGFIFMLERVIEPEAAQRDTLEKIIAKYSERFFEVASQSRAEMAVIMDSLRLELDPILTEEQKARIEEMRQRIESRRPFDRPFKRKKRPPFENRRHGSI